MVNKENTFKNLLALTLVYMFGMLTVFIIVSGTSIIWPPNLVEENLIDVKLHYIEFFPVEGITIPEQISSEDLFFWMKIDSMYINSNYSIISYGCCLGTEICHFRATESVKEISIPVDRLGTTIAIDRDEITIAIITFG